MIYELLTNAIENPNPYMDTNTLKLQVEFFKTAEKITQAERDELILMFPIAE